ncbi:hypothetical protein QFZ79_001564 [Arthrobacter sp. V4I6]|nr:hypothetical protein [Arthrobacter sp. V1I7]MDQ0853453.1 hypothetical protein [Arthrobacter sp. V4I6]
MFPRTPQRLYTGDCFRVEVPVHAPFCGAAVDISDLGGQQLLVHEFFGGAVDQLWWLLLLPRCVGRLFYAGAGPFTESADIDRSSWNLLPGYPGISGSSGSYRHGHFFRLRTVLLDGRLYGPLVRAGAPSFRVLAPAAVIQRTESSSAACSTTPVMMCSPKSHTSTVWPVNRAQSLRSPRPAEVLPGLVPNVIRFTSRARRGGAGPGSRRR